MTHPLTDGIIEDIAHKTIYSDETVRTGGLGVPTYHDGSVMLRYADMRGAANWQLEQVIKFMEEHEQLFGGSGMIFILKDAMRPLHPIREEDN